MEDYKDFADVFLTFVLSPSTVIPETPYVAKGGNSARTTAT
jgi:hypothetical protein